MNPASAIPAPAGSMPIASLICSESLVQTSLASAVYPRRALIKPPQAPLAEVVGVLELDHAVSDRTTLATLPVKTHQSEFRKELSTIHQRASELKNAFNETLPLHWYFKGKVSGLKNASRYSFQDLCVKFEATRESAHEKREDWKKHNFLSGVAAGLAEVIALAKFTRDAD